MPKITRESKIKKIKDFLRENYNVPKEKETIFNLLLEEIAWQINELADLRHDINLEGRMVDFVNGSQEFQIVNPKVKMYDSLIKSYNLTVRTLNDIAKGTGGKNDKQISDTPEGFNKFLDAVKEARKSGVK